MKVSIFMVSRHYASVPTNLFQISALAYGALNGFPQSKDSKNKRQSYNNRKTMVPLYLMYICQEKRTRNSFLPPPSPCRAVIPAYPLPPPLHIVVSERRVARWCPWPNKSKPAFNCRQNQTGGWLQRICSLGSAFIMAFTPTLTQYVNNRPHIQIHVFYFIFIFILFPVQSFIIYLPWVLCLSVCDWVCVCVTIAERTAVLLVLVIKLIKETRRRAWRGRDRDGEIGKGQIREGGYEWTFHC